MSGNEKKWSCEYCTYENYPSALKCTMCRGSRPFISEDIYSLHNNDDKINSAAGSCDNQQNINSWQCDTCTYINHNKDHICTQCGSAFVSASNMQDYMQTLKITPHSDLAQSLSQPRNNSPPSSLTNVENTKKMTLRKWKCTVCTYENWPRATKCSMCSYSPQISQRPPSSSHIIPPSNQNIDVNNQEDLYRTPSNIIEENNCEAERQLRLMRRNADWNWLNACVGVIEGDPVPVENYLSAGGDPARTLTASEVAILNRSSAFDVGYTLVHLAIRFQRDDLLATLLTQIEGSGSGLKKVPSYIAPDLAADIRRHFAATIRHGKGSFPCSFVTEFPTFALPAEVDELPGPVQDQLFEELLDKDAQAQLESEPAVINWSLDLTVRLESRLHALWNRSAGNCLLDSVMQATWGVFDRDNHLRRTLAESLNQGSNIFYPRWREYEANHASFLQYSLEEEQWEEDWSSLLSLASSPGMSLEMLHVFALAHILRRPIIVYGVKFVKSFRGETLDYSRFEGVYLPLLCEQSFCVRTPIALGYTRGHFSALVPIEPYSRNESGLPKSNLGPDELQCTFLPLMDRDRKLLPIHFLLESEMGKEEDILRQWMDVWKSKSGILVAKQYLHKRPLLVAQMVEEWLNHYRRLAQMTGAPFTRPVPVLDYSSDGDSDDE